MKKRNGLSTFALTCFAIALQPWGFSDDALSIDPNGNVSIGGTPSSDSKLSVSGNIMSSGSGGSLSAPVPDQGAHLDWNLQAKGNTYFINQRGKGTGGFLFYNATEDGTLGNTIFDINSSGTTAYGLATSLHTLATGSGNTLSSKVPVQGAYLDWNLQAKGYTYLINQRGSGNGGFLFYNATGDGTLGSSIFDIENNGTVAINGSEGNMVFTSPHAETPASTWASSIDFGNGTGLQLRTTVSAGTPVSDTFSFYTTGDSGGFLTLSPTNLGTHLASPQKDKGLHLSSNGKAVTISNDGTPPDAPHESAALHVDGKIAHLGQLKLSDRSAKTNISPIENGLDKVVALAGVKYDWKEAQPKDNITQEYGFIAQDVEAIVPEAISKDAAGTNYMDYDALIPLLVEAIKEQQGVIESLEKRLLAVEVSP